MVSFGVFMRYMYFLPVFWACSPADNSQVGVDPLDEPSYEAVNGNDEPSAPTNEPNSPTSEPNSPTSEPESSSDCEGDYSATNNYDCAVDFIDCGDEIVMSTEGGTTYEYFNSSQYTSWYEISSNDNDYNGSERGFFFNHPGGGAAQLTLTSSCGDADLFAFHLPDGECPVASCPTCQTSVSSQKSGTQDDVIQLFDNNPTTHMIVVEGPPEGFAVFTLKVECASN